MVKEEMARVNINILGMNEPERENLIQMIIISTIMGKNP